MKIQELLTEPRPLLEGLQLDVYNALLPHLMISEEDGDSPGDGGTPPDVVPDPPPVQPPGGGGWYRPGPFRPGGGMSGNFWFNQLYTTLKNLVVMTNISKRLKQLGITGEGAKRVKKAQQMAAKHVKLLLTNPGTTAYRIPVWTTAKPPKPVIKMWNEAFAKQFELELSKVNLTEDKEADFLFHDYKKGDIVTVIENPRTRTLHGKKLMVIKQLWKDDGKYVTVETERDSSGLGVRADVKVAWINSLKAR